MKTKISVTFQVLLGIAVVAMLAVQAEISRSMSRVAECLIAPQICVIPDADESPTNAFAVYAKDLTNYFGIDPTNAVPRIGIGGTNCTGMTTNYAVVNTNRSLIFRRGILIGVE
jgi:hypothetical protein